MIELPPASYHHYTDTASARSATPGLAAVIMLLEGAFVLGRTTRSTVPLDDAGRVAATEVHRLL
ncbi:MAG: hypothetical protein IPH29_19385 [Candidatus Microthrix sp.]|nr:hypothetical protein [Candidatus Microthrix sp.]